MGDVPGRADRLDSWKAIATYLKRDVRTVQRWERLERLPVHRQPNRAAGVFAYTSELDAWRETARTTAMPAATPRRWARVAAAGVAALAVGVASIWLRAGNTGGASPATRMWMATDARRLGVPSPDGRYLSYLDESGNLAIRDLQSGSSRPFINEGARTLPLDFAAFSAFSRDSRRLAYAWFANGSVELRIASLEGQSSRVVYRDLSVRAIRPVAWTRQGDEILCVLDTSTAERLLAFVSTGDGRRRIVGTLDAGAPEGVALSPDDHAIAYDAPVGTGQNRNVVIVASDGSRHARIARPGANDVTPVWTPDGAGVLFVSDPAGAPTLRAASVTDVEPAESRLVQAGLPVRALLGFSDAGTLLYSVEASRTDVYTAALDPTSQQVGVHTLVDGRFGGRTIMSDWSPDGRSLVYLSQQSVDDRYRFLTLASLAGRDQREHRLPVRDGWIPRWAPDGGSILYTARGQTLIGAVYRIDVATGRSSLILERDQAASAFAPAWFPDGRSIVVTLAEPRQAPSLARVEVSSGRIDILYRAAPDESVGEASVSADGRAVAFGVATSATSVLKVLAPDGQPHIVAEARLPQTVSAPVWMPNGRQLLFLKWGPEKADQRELWVVDVSTGAQRRAGLSAENLRYVRIRPDGRHLAFSAGGPVMELWTLSRRW